MFAGVVRALREIAARPASLLLAALAIFLAALTTLAWGRLLLQILLSSLQGEAPPSTTYLLALATLTVAPWSAIWPLWAAALRHVEEGDISSLCPAARHAPSVLLLGVLAILAKLVSLLLLVVAVALLLRPAGPAARSLLFALVLLPGLMLVVFADCTTLMALPLVSRRGLAAFTPNFHAALRFPQRALGILLFCALLLAPLFLLATPLSVGAVRWPPTPASLISLLGLSLCLAPAPLLFSKALSEGLLLHQERHG